MIAVAYWWGWVLAHPAPALITAACAGVLTVLAVLMWAENRRDDRAAGPPPSPRRDPPRSRARGTRARRQVTERASRRVRAMVPRASRPARQARNRAAHWAGQVRVLRRWPGTIRAAIALRARGITIDLTGRVPAEQDWSAWGGKAPCCCERENSADDATTAETDCPRHGNSGYGPENFIPPTRLATDAERHQAGLPAPWYAPELAPRAELSPWEHTTMEFSLAGLDASIKAREAAAAGGDT